MRYLSGVSVLPRPQFGEAAGVLMQEAKQSTAVDRVSSKMHFSHIKKAHLKSQYQFKCMPYLEYFY